MPLVVRELVFAIDGDWNEEALERFGFPRAALGAIVCPVRELRNERLAPVDVASSSTGLGASNGWARGVLADSVRSDWWRSSETRESEFTLVPPESAAVRWELDTPSLRALLTAPETGHFRRDVGAWQGLSDSMPPESLEERMRIAQLESIVGLLVDRALELGAFNGNGVAPIQSGANERSTEFELDVSCVADLEHPFASAWPDAECVFIAPFVGLTLDHAHVEITLRGRGVSVGPFKADGARDVSGTFESRVSIHAHGQVSPVGCDLPAHITCELDGVFDVSRRRWLE